MTRAFAGCLAAIAIFILSVPAHSATMTATYEKSGTFSDDQQIWFNGEFPDTSPSLTVTVDPSLNAFMTGTGFDGTLGVLREVRVSYRIGYAVTNPFDTGLFELGLAVMGNGGSVGRDDAVLDWVSPSRASGSVLDSFRVSGPETAFFTGYDVGIMLYGRAFIEAVGKDTGNGGMHYDLGVSLTYVYDPVAAVPLPPALALFAAGLGALGLAARRRRRAG